MGRKVKIEPDKRSSWWRNGDPGVTFHTTSEPFVMSLLGQLVHRVKHRTTFTREWREPHTHDAATFWCGNGTGNPEFFYDVPAGRMVCARCEAQMAIDAARRGAEHKRAADLVGHKLNLGAMVPIKVGEQLPTRKKAKPNDEGHRHRPAGAYRQVLCVRSRGSVSLGCARVDGHGSDRRE